ncbi:trigger factor [Sulfuriferula plumbiphila]|uniref:Trigger factor n=1 Tax=Sulfuriferula plumbiphila TaxID=171865 RepID=A0A512L8Y2_9PROT|nr:trigger factor [Sulfuriferula plumbiphila]BBP04575.1 trigger factor [Sulfuriferula plumbiphila]GEP30601.1 trigger factor [Sulfuriferula plumbiphila]
MQVNLEQISTLERRINLAVPMQQIETEVNNRLRDIARNTKLDGFRRGKVPLSLVTKQYGGQIHQEVLGDAVQKSFMDAIQAHRLKVAGYPRIEPRTDAADKEAIEFSATFEVYPEITLGDIGSAKITRPVVTVGDADVDKTLDVLRKQRVQFNTVDRASQTGDLVTLDYVGKIDGAVFAGGEAKGFRVVLGEGRTLAEFETALVDVKAGDNTSFNVTFPGDYHARELAGKTAAFEVSVVDIAAPQLPEVDAEFARSLGITDGDVQKMRAEIQANLEREVKNRIHARLKEQIMQAFLDSTKIDVPRSLLEMETQRLMQNARKDMQARGMNVNDVPLPADIFAEQAMRRVSLGLILAEAVRVNELTAKPEQITALIQEFAQSYEDPQEVIKWHHQTPERMQEIESLALENNVVEWALERVQVEDQSVSFDELMGKA